MAGPPDVDDAPQEEATTVAAGGSVQTTPAPMEHKRATWRDEEEPRARSQPAAASSDSSSGSSLAIDAPAPPDGGYGWVVVVAAFFVNLIADGITFSFGVIYVDFLAYFNAGKSNTSWIGSLFMAMPLLSGPIASFLTDRYGCRRVTMVGGVLAATGFVLSSMTESIGLLLLTFGVIAGFGLALCYVAAVVIVAYYFESKRSFATGLSQCGSGIGTLLFAPFTQVLLSHYGWRGTTLILAGCFLNLAVCGALMRDVEWHPRRKASKARGRLPEPEQPAPRPEELHQLIEEHAGEDANRLCSSLVALPTFVKSGEKVPLEALHRLSAHRPMYDVLVQNYPSLLISHSLSDSGGACKDDFGQNQLHSLTYRGAMLNINRYRLRASSCPDIYRNSMTTIGEDKEEWYSGLAELKTVMLDILDFSYFADLRFSLFAASNFLLYMWYDVPYVYLADFAIERNFAQDQAARLISTIGIINMVGEIGLGWAGDKSWVDAGTVYAGCMVLCGAVTATVPLFSNYWALSACAGTFGLFIGANYSLTSIILVELITLERFTNAYGLLLLVQGIANLIGPPLAGWLYDITGTYHLSFYLAGLFIALSGLLLLVVPCTKHVNKRRQCKSDTPASNGASSQFITIGSEKEAAKV
ncbi:hypothetical protein B566_EDAN015323 [Ephemera danica]|nr:hypothetical protein B566_EDAN015323 [Ephemera danica]